ncbi:MAG: helix-turn-helix domain-containing protein [Pseudomonadota bacterium]
MNDFPRQLRDWRQVRRLSQLNLAMAANVSARHISFLETGRSRPSREMIAHLGRVLELPLAAVNRMLLAAGFAPRYPRTRLDADAMAPVASAVAWTLDRHAPYPGMALDRDWTIHRLNAPAAKLFAGLGIGAGDSLLDLITNPAMPQLVENWPVVAHASARRLRAESAAAGGLHRLETTAEYLSHQPLPDSVPDGPAIPTIYRFGDVRLSLFGMIAAFSSVNDETLDDLRLELFYPADKETEAFLTTGSG